MDDAVIKFLSELTVGGQIALSISLCCVLYVIFAPWLSLTNLSKLNDIAYELRRIRELLEKRAK